MTERTEAGKDARLFFLENFIRLVSRTKIHSQVYTEQGRKAGEEHDMENTKTWTIADIEALDEDAAFELAEDTTVIKDHDVCFVDFGGYFGFSALVFCNGHHIKYANDYELHHRPTQWDEDQHKKTHEELRALYEEKLRRTLFTDDELTAPLAEYDEFQRRERFLRDLYPLRVDHLSIFGIDYSGATVTHIKEQSVFDRLKGNYPYYSDISFCYYADKDFRDRQDQLYAALEAAKDGTLENFDYWVDAFKYEMANHEYHINWQADFDTIGAFAAIPWRGDDADVNKYFDDACFNDVQRRAYLEAYRQYFAELDG